MPSTSANCQLVTIASTAEITSKKIASARPFDAGSTPEAKVRWRLRGCRRSEDRSSRSLSVYLLNDLLDLSSDRRHPRKRQRTFASGVLPASKGLALAIFLLVISAVLAIVTNWQFAEVLGIYYLTTVAYSF